MLGRDEAADGDRAQIGDHELVPRLERLGGRRIERDRESRRALEQAEKNGLGGTAERARLGQA